LTSLDNWEEILDGPEDFDHDSVGIVRSNSNWLARIAAACVSVQLGYKTILLPDKIECWHCCCRLDWKWGKAPVLDGRTQDEDGAATPTRTSRNARSMANRDVGDCDKDDDDLYDSDNESVLENDKYVQPQIFVC
jgi:hypothetical protein